MQSIPTTSVFDVLLHPWPPCTGSSSTLDYLKQCKFPSSYRPLCQRWNVLGRPTLQSTTACNLEEKALHEEYISLAATTGQKQRTLEDFSTFCHDHCRISVELSAMEAAVLEEPFDTRSAFEYDRRMLLAALESDRSSCLQLGEHDCLGKRLWGPAYTYDPRTLWHLTSSPRDLVPSNTIERTYSTTSSHTDPPHAYPPTNSYQHLRRPAFAHHVANVATIYSSGSQGSSHSSPSSLLSHKPDVYIAESFPVTLQELRVDHRGQSEGSIGVESVDDNEGGDVDSAGELERRKRRNRIKSKRHRDRMIQQRNLLIDIMSAFRGVCFQNDYQPKSDIGHKIYGIVIVSGQKELTYVQGTRQDNKERQRRNKAMQRSEELEGFKHISLIASLLSSERIDISLLFDLLAHAQGPSVQVGNGDLHTFLGILVGFRVKWDILLEAESRLCFCAPASSGGRRPIGELVDRLTDLLKASPSST